jgi:hypothetical protein
MTHSWVPTDRRPASRPHLMSNLAGIVFDLPMSFHWPDALSGDAAAHGHRSSRNFGQALGFCTPIFFTPPFVLCTHGPLSLYCCFLVRSPANLSCASSSSLAYLVLPGVSSPPFISFSNCPTHSSNCLNAEVFLLFLHGSLDYTVYITSPGPWTAPPIQPEYCLPLTYFSPEIEYGHYCYFVQDAITVLYFNSMHYLRAAEPRVPL